MKKTTWYNNGLCKPLTINPLKLAMSEILTIIFS